MELRHLRYFLRVAEEENVSRAAEKLHLSQPALSRQVRDLEDDIGFALFERGAKSMRLTAAGRVFKEESRAVLQRADDAIRAAQVVANGKSAELHIGYAPSLTARILPQTLRTFQSRHPRIRVKLHDLSTAEMIEGLRAGKLNLAFMLQIALKKNASLKFEGLAKDSLCLAVSPNHQLARRKNISIDEIVKEPLVTYDHKEYPEAHAILISLFSERHLRPHVLEEHESVSSMIAALEAGNCAAIVLRSLSCISGPRLKLIPFAPELDDLLVGIAWKNNRLDGSSQDFLACAKESSPRIQKTSKELLHPSASVAAVKGRP